jgi:hypothetical protein
MNEILILIVCQVETIKYVAMGMTRDWRCQLVYYDACQNKTLTQAIYVVVFISISMFGFHLPSSCGRSGITNFLFSLPAGHVAGCLDFT